MAFIDVLFLVLGVAVGFTIRHERQTRRENLVLEQVDARLRRELEIARNLNESLLADLAAIKQQARPHNDARGPGQTLGVTAP